MENMQKKIFFGEVKTGKLVENAASNQECQCSFSNSALIFHGWTAWLCENNIGSNVFHFFQG